MKLPTPPYTFIVYVKLYQATLQLQARLRAFAAVDVAVVLMGRTLMLSPGKVSLQTPERIPMASALSALQNSVHIPLRVHGRQAYVFLQGLLPNAGQTP